MRDFSDADAGPGTAGDVFADPPPLPDSDWLSTIATAVAVPLHDPEFPGTRPEPEPEPVDASGAMGAESEQADLPGSWGAGAPDAEPLPDRGDDPLDMG